MEPRTPHSFSRVDDPDAADIDNLERVCHATAPKPRVFAKPGAVVRRRLEEKNCPESLRGSSWETAIFCLRRADDEVMSKKQLPRTRRRSAITPMIRGPAPRSSRCCPLSSPRLVHYCASLRRKIARFLIGPCLL